ncbi:SigB/SigF/SigG family RNA polymerase sigma factor [Marinactinospora thermotolerans]|uniref:RNA polymerase sigma-B factor n=1 Tax=Marinactinospora thermotolerans DSM 45154 TaxID=1122192 RepID=A0A1T4K4N6_9ACTN|nr:SigB/SigF/SigG family RNA polymerase sigma factor [Marinactinospora thermotolerans]SJZ37391.1 RNA polymerase sigma-B factor [Marinactinospora thermotolerans DSM 45154]
MRASSTLHEQTDTSIPQPRSPRNRTSDEEYRRQTRELLERLRTVGRDDPQRERICHRLIELHIPVVRRIARQYRNRGESEEDLRQVAMVGLMQAIRDFNPDYGKEFISYALPMMTGEVKRHFRDRTWAIRVPRKHQEKRSELNRATATFTQENGRTPTVAEIAKMLEMSVEDTIELIAASTAYSALSLDVPYGADEEEKTLGDTIGQNDEDLESVVDRAALRPALAALAPRERRILLLRFAGNKTQAQIAELVGLSQMHVSRTLSATLRKLRAELLGDV